MLCGFEGGCGVEMYVGYQRRVDSLAAQAAVYLFQGGCMLYSLGGEANELGASPGEPCGLGDTCVDVEGRRCCHALHAHRRVAADNGVSHSDGHSVPPH